MLFDAGNPYRGGLPATLQLSWEDFSCGLSPANDAALGRRAAWNVLVYAAADNDLAAPLFDNLLELKALGSNPAVHVCVLFDGPLLTDSFFARLNANGPLGDDIVVRYGELHSNAPETLTLALRLSALFPAERRLVILSGHGKGWSGALLDRDLGLAYKREPGRLILPGRAEDCDARLLAAQKAVQARLDGVAPPAPEAPVDVLALDACYMGSLEALPFFASQAETLVVSEDQEPAQGYPYGRLLRALCANPAQSPAELAAYLVGETKGFYDDPGRRRNVTQIALTSKQLEPLAAAFVALIQVLDVTDDAEFAVVRQALEQAWQFEPTGGIDLKGFVLKLRGHPSDAVRAAAQTFLARWEALVAAAAVEGSEDGTNGLSIYAPPPARFDVAYVELGNRLTLGLGIWCWFLAGYYLRVLGSEAPQHPLIRSIQATLERAVRSGDYVPGGRPG